MKSSFLQPRFWAMGIILVFGVLIVVAIMQWGVQPRPTPILGASFFSKPEEIGAVVLRHMYDRIGREAVVVIGVTPGVAAHAKIVEGLVWTALQEGRPFQVVYQSPNLNPIRLPEGTISKDLRSQQSEKEILQLALDASAEQNKQQKGQDLPLRALVYTTANLSSHLVAGSLVQHLEAAAPIPPLFSISIARLPVAGVDDGPRLQPDIPCTGSEFDQKGLRDLGCSISLKSRTLQRKSRRWLDKYKAQPDQPWVALLDQMGKTDYLLFLAQLHP